MPQQFDVFLSHSSVDKPWVIKLKDDLQRYGVSVWLDKDEIRPGDLFAEALEQALDNCRAVVLVVSPAAIASGWVKEEYYRALSLTKSKKPPVQLIPIILHAADLPGFIKSRNYIDFRDEAAYGHNVWQLVWGITDKKPAKELDLASPGLLPAPTGYMAGIPALPNYFVGRDMVLDDLIQRLTSGNNTLALSAEGLGGVGKTTLAVALAYDDRIRSHFSDGVLWAGLGPRADESTVMTLLESWATALGHDIAGLTGLAKRQQALKTMIGEKRILLIIDDAWDIDLAQDLRCGGPHCRHLLTTRNQTLANAFAGAANAQRVTTLAEDPAWELLQKLAPAACAADPAAARALSQAVGGLPLALELLGGYLNEAVPSDPLFADVGQNALADLASPHQRLQLAQQRLGGSGKKVSLHDAVILSLDGLPPAAIDAFYALGAFAPKPERFSREAAEAVTEADGATLALLVTRNLLEVEDERLALHQVLADVAREHMPEAAVERHRDTYLALANEDRDDWRAIEAVYGQIKWAWQATTDPEAHL